MNNDVTTTMYRRTPLWEFFLAQFLTILILIVPIFFIYYENNIDNSWDIIFLVFLVVLLGGLVLFSIIFETFRYFHSYLKISKNRIEYRHWPFTWHNVRWEDIERIENTKWLSLSLGDVIYVKDAEIQGSPLLPWIKKQLRLSPDYSIYLANRKRRNLYGWPNGQLADDLRKYAPHLFSEDAKQS